MHPSAKPAIEPKHLTPGLYRHFKGHLYEVLGTVVHSETLQTMVLYHPIGSDVLWVRPYEMFSESVTPPDGTSPVPRFAYLGNPLS